MWPRCTEWAANESQFFLSEKITDVSVCVRTCACISAPLCGTKIIECKWRRSTAVVFLCGTETDGDLKTH